MICLIILIIISCNSTNYYEINGLKNEILTRKQGSSYTNIIDYRANNRVGNNNKEEGWTEAVTSTEESGIGGESLDKEVIVWEKEVKNMENLNELITVIGSAIAGVYCAVKAIINAIKSLKKKN